MDALGAHAPAMTCGICGETDLSAAAFPRHIRSKNHLSRLEESRGMPSLKREIVAKGKFSVAIL
jgi:hypothetical protein